MPFSLPVRPYTRERWPSRSARDSASPNASASGATDEEGCTSDMVLWSVGGRHGECLLAGAADAEHGKALGPGVYPCLRVRFRRRSVAAQLSTLSSRLFLAPLFRHAG